LYRAVQFKRWRVVVVVESEEAMVRKLDETQVAEKFTSLQPTYEDTVAPDPDDWELDD
jgi:hypothetical protein